MAPDSCLPLRLLVPPAVAVLLLGSAPAAAMGLVRKENMGQAGLNASAVISPLTGSAAPAGFVQASAAQAAALNTPATPASSAAASGSAGTKYKWVRSKKTRKCLTFLVKPDNTTIRLKDCNASYTCNMNHMCQAFNHEKYWNMLMSLRRDQRCLFSGPTGNLSAQYCPGAKNVSFSWKYNKTGKLTLEPLNLRKQCLTVNADDKTKVKLMTCAKDPGKDQQWILPWKCRAGCGFHMDWVPSSD